MKSMTIYVLHRGSYAGIYTSGFKDFLMKNKILLAIQDAAFEHPSEGSSIFHSLNLISISFSFT